MQEFSPEQIISQLLLEGFPYISTQTIYRHIRKNRRRGGHLYKYLRIMPKRRKKKYRSADSRGVLRRKRNISERPKYINERKTSGHWEGDTVMGKDHNQCVLTLVERKTGLNRMAKLKNRTAKETCAAVIAIIKKEPGLFKTITFDNGTEFHSYKEIERQTGVIIYFANPHHPWERGCNENFNGLLRQYLPKGHSLSYIGENRLQNISDRLNCRTRKRLGFKTPQEAMYGI
jgi:IS30 family transposase